MGLQNVNENEFHGFGNLAIWLWNSFGSFLKEVCTNTGSRGENTGVWLCHTGVVLKL